MRKRAVTFGSYDTALYGWTLTGCTLSAPEQKTNYVEKPGGDGSWDLSTVLTGGLPRYKDRTLTVTLECSEGTRDDRMELIGHLVNALDGLEHRIMLPDYPNHYLTGRAHVSVDYNTPAHAAVTISATCGPWFQRTRETVVNLTAGTEPQTVTLRNCGRRAVAPRVTVSGDGADVLLAYGTMSQALTAGTYEWPTLLLTTGDHVLTYSGRGAVTITYREAVLL